MAAIDYVRPVSGHFSIGRLGRILAAVAIWNDTRRTRAALSKLSDHELDDIGLTRSDIETL